MREMKGYARAQAVFDAMLPPEYYEGYSEESDDEACTECGMVDCECTYCPECKTTNGCSCDEQYEAYKDWMREDRGL